VKKSFHGFSTKTVNRLLATITDSNGFPRYAWTHLYLSQLTVKVISSLPAKYKLLSNQSLTVLKNMHYCRCLWPWHILNPSQMFQKVNRLWWKPGSWMVRVFSHKKRAFYVKLLLPTKLRTYVLPWSTNFSLNKP